MAFCYKSPIGRAIGAFVDRVPRVRRCIASSALIALLVGAGTLHADEAAAPAPPWCAPELETLPGDVCFHPGPTADDGDGPRTLVVFLHGLVSVGVDWQHQQQRAAVRGGARNRFAVLAPKAVVGARRDPDQVAWPTNAASQAKHEAGVLGRIREARAMIERRQGAPFDEVFVVGFSNGAYYASSLALRAALDADGYAAFAGGTSYGATTDERAPLFVGICAKDATSRDDSRKLERHLKRLGWPHRATTRKVGHLMSDSHLDEAIAYLRAALSKKP